MRSVCCIFLLLFLGFDMLVAGLPQADPLAVRHKLAEPFEPERSVLGRKPLPAFAEAVPTQKVDVDVQRKQHHARAKRRFRPDQCVLSVSPTPTVGSGHITKNTPTPEATATTVQDSPCHHIANPGDDMFGGAPINACECKLKNGTYATISTIKGENPCPTTLPKDLEEKEVTATTGPLTATFTEGRAVKACESSWRIKVSPNSWSHYCGGASSVIRTLPPMKPVVSVDRADHAGVMSTDTPQSISKILKQLCKDSPETYDVTLSPQPVTTTTTVSGELSLVVSTPPAFTTAMTSCRPGSGTVTKIPAVIDNDYTEYDLTVSLYKSQFDEEWLDSFINAVVGYMQHSVDSNTTTGTSYNGGFQFHGQSGHTFHYGTPAYLHWYHPAIIQAVQLFEVDLDWKASGSNSACLPLKALDAIVGTIFPMFKDLGANLVVLCEAVEEITKLAGNEPGDNVFSKFARGLEDKLTEIGLGDILGLGS